MDYDSPGAYKKNKLNVDIVYNGGRWRCDRCKKRPDRMVVILRGGYVQEQVCLACAGKITGRKYV